MLKAVGKNVIVKEVVVKSTSQLQLNSTDNTRPLRCVVVDSATDEISVDDIVHINQFSVARIKHNDVEYIAVSKEQVICKETN